MIFSFLLCFLTFLSSVFAGESAWGNWNGANTVTTVTTSVVSTAVTTATIISTTTTTGPGGVPATVTVSTIITLPVTIYTTVPTTFITTVPTTITSVSVSTSNSITTTTVSGTTSISALTTTVTSYIPTTLNNGQTSTITEKIVQTLYSSEFGYGYENDSTVISTHNSMSRVLIAAIVIAAVVGFVLVILLALCLACCCIRRRRQRNNGSDTSINNFFGGWYGGLGGGKGSGSNSSSSAQMSQTNVGVIGGNSGTVGSNANAAATAGAIGAGGAMGGAREHTNVRESINEVDDRRTTVISIQHVQELNLFGAQGDYGKQQQRSSVNNLRYTINENQGMAIIEEGMAENHRDTGGRCRRHSHSNCSCRHSHYNHGESLNTRFNERHRSRYSGSARGRYRSGQLEDVERQDRYRGWVETQYEENERRSQYQFEDSPRLTKRNTIYEERMDKIEVEDELSVSSTSLRIRSHQGSGEESSAVFRALRSIGDTMDMDETELEMRNAEHDRELEEENLRLGSNWMDVVNEGDKQKSKMTDVTVVEVDEEEIDVCDSVHNTHVRGEQIEIEQAMSTELMASQTAKELHTVEELPAAQRIAAEEIQQQQNNMIMDFQKSEFTRLALKAEQSRGKATITTITELDDTVVESDEFQSPNQHSRARGFAESSFSESDQLSQQIDGIDMIGVESLNTTVRQTDLSKSKSITSITSGFSTASTQVGMDAQSAKTAMTYQNLGSSFATQRYSARGGVVLKSAASNGAGYETSIAASEMHIVKPVTIVEVQEVDRRLDGLY